MSKQEMRKLYQHLREMSKDRNFTIFTPKAPPMSGRSPKVQEGPIVIDYLSTLV